MFTITIQYQYKDQIVQQAEHTSKTVSSQSIYKLFEKDLEKRVLDVFFPSKNRALDPNIIDVYYIDSDFQRISLEQKQIYYFAQKQSLHQGRKLTIILHSNIKFQFKKNKSPDKLGEIQIVKSKGKAKYQQDLYKDQYNKKLSFQQQLQTIKQKMGWNTSSIERKPATQIVNKDLQSGINSNQFQILYLKQIVDEKSQIDKNQDSFELLHSPREAQSSQPNKAPQQKDKIFNKNNYQKLHQQNYAKKSQKQLLTTKDYQVILCNSCHKQLNSIPLPIFVDFINNFYCQQCQNLSQKHLNTMITDENVRRQLFAQRNIPQFERVARVKQKVYWDLEQRISKREKKVKCREKIKQNNKNLKIQRK